MSDPGVRNRKISASMFAAPFRRFENFLRLHDAPHTQSELMRARACYLIGLMFIVTQLINLVNMSWAYRTLTADHLISVKAILVVGATIVSLRWSKRMWLVASIYSVMVVGGIIASAWPTGLGINTSLLPMLILAIVLNGFVAGWRAALGFGAIALALTWALYWHSNHAHSPTIFVDRADIRLFQRAMQTTLAIVCVTGASALFACYMDRAFAKLEAALRRARDSDRAKTEFLSTISHELLTPLNAVVGLSDALRRTPLGHEQRSFVETIGHSGEMLQRTISNVLTYALLDASRLKLDHSPFELIEALREAIAPHALAARAKGLVFDERLSTQLPGRAIGDSKRVVRLVCELLDNAVQFTDTGRVEIRIAASQDEGRHVVALSVTDTGPGIDRDQLSLIFERFTQADGSIRREHGGIGLGLNISRGLTRAMGGDLTVESRPGQGSRFVAHFWLDAVDEEAEAKTVVDLVPELAGPKAAPAVRPAHLPLAGTS